MKAINPIMISDIILAHDFILSHSYDVIGNFNSSPKKLFGLYFKE